MKKISLFLLCLLLTPVGMAQDIEPEDAIKYRKAIMSAIKGHNNAIRSIVSSKVPFSNRLNDHVMSLQQLYAELDQIFPEGSDFGKTNAKEAIWDDPDKFNATIKKSQEALDTFAAVIAKGNLSESASAAKKFGKESCGSCHKLYKKKDN
ncbi:MAG: cytochrome c [Gammaproteobacteria bacterium]|nr:cytochrome c [Gammaproteobacteria bacterium]